MKVSQISALILLLCTFHQRTQQSREKKIETVKQELD